jgi:hypothetical protein
MKRLGISTSLIDKKETYTIKDKTKYNHNNCIIVDSLLRYKKTCYKVLVLDHLDLGTSTSLHETLGIPLFAIDLVSRSVSFKPDHPKNHGLCYTGQMSSFIDEYGDKRVYDAMILDFCCVWKKDILALVTCMLQKQMLCDLSVVSFTFSNRYKTDVFKGNKIQARYDLHCLFDAHGYHLQWWMEHEDGLMYSLYGKCIHKKGALDHRKPKMEFGDASNWLMLNPLQYNKVKKRKKITTWTCDKGHDLVFEKSPKEGSYKFWNFWSCDNCFEDFPLKEAHLRCNLCCYDLCANCK